MSKASEDKLYGLLALAEEQQTAVRAGVQGLAIERAAMAAERLALVQQTEAMRNRSEELANTVVKMLPQMAHACAVSATLAVEKALAGAAQTSTQAATLAAGPTLASLTTAMQSADAVQLALRQAVKDFARQWAWVMGTVAAAAILTVALAAWGLVWWQRQELQDLAAEHDRLTAEVSALQSQIEQARKSGGRKPAR